VKARVVRVTSANDVFQELEALKRNREKRARRGEFFVEGVKPLTLAVANEWRVRCLVYQSGLSLSGWARQMLASAGAEVHYEMAPNLFAELSDKNEPGELLGVVRAERESVDRITAQTPAALLAVVCDRPSGHGNLGTLIRSANAFRADGMVLSGHCVDPWDSACIRASVGTIFALPVVRVQSPRDVLQWASALRAAQPDLMVVGTSASAETDLQDFDWTGPRVVLIGNETHGLCRAYKDGADAMVRIPIHGAASSTNVAVAGSIVLYEIDRQRRNAAAAPV
jgi:TrmH family RNA methyltransferase